MAEKALDKAVEKLQLIGKSGYYRALARKKLYFPHRFKELWKLALIPPGPWAAGLKSLGNYFLMFHMELGNTIRRTALSGDSYEEYVRF